ncbi:hypothetical protein MMC09_004656 [Bachmanniomyces sp. S44760]|nr:hypothetical protein [Bachmanniomyces sp. S44760]
MAKRSREDSISSVASSSSTSNNGSPSPFKYTQTAADEIEVMQCSLPPHQPLSFTSYDAYDVHYAQAHTNRCSACARNFPTDHFLNLHIAEHHDPLNEAQRALGDKTSFNFSLPHSGVDHTTSLLRSSKSQHRRRNSAAHKAMFREKDNSLTKNVSRIPSNSRSGSENCSQLNGASTEPAIIVEATPSKEPTVQQAQAKPSSNIDLLANSMSALKFVPPSVRAGRRK